jgi:hypothetical protein
VLPREVAVVVRLFAWHAASGVVPGDHDRP